MANIIQIKRGENAPTVDVLEDYELGYSTNEKALYINDNGIIRLTGLPLSGGNITGNLTIQENNVYHEGNKPTASDVGALSTSGGTVTGNVTFNGNVNGISAADVGALPITGGTLTGSLAMTGTLNLPAGGVTKVGKYIDFIEEDEVDYSTRLYSNNGILNSTGEIYVDENQVYHTGNKSVLEHITETDDIDYTRVDINTDAKINGAIQCKSLELIPNEGSTHGGHIDFHYGGENVDYTSRIFEYASGQIGVYGDLNVNNSIKINSINIFELVYPVGSIYMSINSTNPGTLFGGTWERWGKGRAVVGVDETDTTEHMWDEAERTSGERFQSLGAAIGATDSNIYAIGYQSTGPIPGSYYNFNGSYGYTGNSGNINHATRVGRLADGKDPCNVQPSIACYLWKRTA